MGEKIENVQPLKGIHQGDSLSLYLFVLCMERLHYVINRASFQNEWELITLKRNEPPLSHLFFTNDLMFFSKASLERAKIIQRWLHRFCKSLRKKVSNEKTRVYFSKNMGSWRVNQISK